MIENPTPPSTDQNVFEPHPLIRAHGTLHEGRVAGALTRWWVYGAESGDTLVLVHGFRGDHHGLELLAQGLLDYRVVIPDLPGFGRTEPLPDRPHTLEAYSDWLALFLEALGDRPVHLVGHSFGSIITSCLAARHRHLLERLSLINPICEPALEGDQKLVSRLAELYYRAGAALPSRWGQRLLKSQLITRVSSEFMMKNKNEQLRQFINRQHAAYFGSFASREALLEAYRASISNTAADFLPEVLAPVQLIVAERDDLGTVDQQVRMYRTLQRPGRLDIIPQVGHLIHYETPQRAAALIRDFHWEDPA